MINSFWGLEPPALLPPNVRLTGPLSKSDQGISQKLLKSQHGELYRFMQGAAEEDRSVLYISLGEKIYYQEWCLKAILDGLKKAHRKLKMKVVWLLR